jgi:hypothetical protein
VAPSRHPCQIGLEVPLGRRIGGASNRWRLENDRGWRSPAVSLAPGADTGPGVASAARDDVPVPAPHPPEFWRRTVELAGPASSRSSCWPGNVHAATSPTADEAGRRCACRSSALPTSGYCLSRPMPLTGYVRQTRLRRPKALDPHTLCLDRSGRRPTDPFLLPAQTPGERHEEHGSRQVPGPNSAGLSTVATVKTDLRSKRSD